MGTKVDLCPEPGPEERALAAAAEDAGFPYHRISAVSGAGVPDLLGATWELLHP